MKEDMTALVLRHIPERVPHTKSELADIYLTESNKIKTDRMKSRDRKRDDYEVVKSRYDSLIADKEAQLSELQDEIEKLRHEMFGQLLYASLEEELRNQELADRRKVLDMWFETMRNRIEKDNDRKRTENVQKTTENVQKTTENVPKQSKRSLPSSLMSTPTYMGGCFSKGWGWR